jgi:hypothetical protein
MRSFSARYPRADVISAAVLQWDLLVKHSAWKFQGFPEEIQTGAASVEKSAILMIGAKCLIVFWQSKGHSHA